MVKAGLTNSELNCLIILGKKFQHVNNQLFNRAVYGSKENAAKTRDEISKFTEMVLVSQRSMIDQVSWLKSEGRKVSILVFLTWRELRNNFMNFCCWDFDFLCLVAKKFYVLKSITTLIFRMYSKNWTSLPETFYTQTSVSKTIYSLNTTKT